MAYTIYKSDGTPVIVNDNSISVEFYDTTGGSTGLGSGIRLVGRNAIDYGVPIAQNFLQMTENFASSGTSRPDGTAALQGMLWHNKTVNALFLKTGIGDLNTDWNRIPRINPTLTPQDGDIQVTGLSASIYVNGSWTSIPTGSSFPLSIGNGGTGETTPQAARNALMPSQGGNSGRFLTTDGTNMSWATIAAGGVSSVSGTTGRITVSGAPSTPVVDIASTYVGQTSITTLGTITSGTWGGTTISIANGGTGQTTANAALNSLLPNQSSNAGRFLTTDGTNTSWAAIAPGGVTNVTASSPVNSTGGATPNISLSAAYGDSINPYGSKVANLVLASPNGSAGIPAFRSLVFTDVSGFSSSTGTALNTLVSRGSGGAVELGQVTAAGPVIGQNLLVLRGLGTGLEGGQIVLGYGNASSITGQDNSTWNIDVTNTNQFRVFRINSAGLTIDPLLISENGDAIFVGDITAFSTSDRRLKTGVEVIPDALDKIMNIKGITYNWNEKAAELYSKDTNVRETGVIAQDIIEVLPEAVTTREDGFLAVRYEKIIPLLVEAIKMLKKEVNNLHAQLNRAQK